MHIYIYIFILDQGHHTSQTY